MHQDDNLTIGALAERSGIAISAIRFYESKGLLAPVRTRGNQRRYRRADLRRLGVIRIAQRLGLSLEEIEVEMATLPTDRPPALGDWQRVSRSMRQQLDLKMQLLTRARAKLDECIGCGCLSLPRCQLFNKNDRVSAAGGGPRLVLED